MKECFACKDRTPTQRLCYECLTKERDALRAELANWERDQIPGMKVLTREEHKNNQAIYCNQVEEIVKLRAALSELLLEVGGIGSPARANARKALQPKGECQHENIKAGMVVDRCRDCGEFM